MSTSILKHYPPEFKKDMPDSDAAESYLRSVAQPGGCFPAGTSITTDKGLVRIEDIKVGDKVLSKSESGFGKQEFKPVVRTVKYDNKELWHLTYCILPADVDSSSITTKSIKNLSRRGKVFGIFATPNHPFWVKDIGWTALDTLQFGQLIEMKDSGTLAFVVMIKPVSQTTESDVAAIPSIRNVLNANARGFEINDEDHYDFIKYYENGDIEILNEQNSASPLLIDGYEPIHVLKETFLTTVYNFEVADHHTYYIFDKLWVHNTTCPTEEFSDFIDLKMRSGLSAPSQRSTPLHFNLIQILMQHLPRCPTLIFKLLIKHLINIPLNTKTNFTSLHLPTQKTAITKPYNLAKIS